MPSADVNGVHLAYQDRGTGPVVVLVHAFPLSSAMWENQISAIAGSHRVIALDLRGFGGSPVVPGTNSMDQYADDVIALLDHLGLGSERIVLGGLSMGGYIAFSILRRYRARLRALILADTRPQADSAEGRKGREKTAQLAEREGAGPIADQMVPKLLAANASPALKEELRAMIVANPPAGIAAALRGMAARPDSTALLAEIKIPTLILVGAEDALTPPTEARAMHAAIANSRLLEIAGAGHLANLEMPTLFNAAVGEFLRGLPPV